MGSHELPGKCQFYDPYLGSSVKGCNLSAEVAHARRPDARQLRMIVPPGEVYVFKKSCVDSA